MYAVFITALLVGLIAFGLVWAGDFFLKQLIEIECDEEL